MKYLYPPFILFLSLMTVTVNGQAWQQLYPPTNKDIKSSSFINDLVGWIGIENSPGDAKLFRTTDGGNTWDDLTINGAASGTTYLEFVNGNVGYAVVNGEAFKTTNGGQSWTGLAFPGTPYYEPCFLNADTGFISGDGTIYKTTNGGMSWITCNAYGGYQPFFNIRFLNEFTGAASEYDGYIWGTEDGGINWYLINDGSLWNYFFSIDFKPGGSLLYTAYTVLGNVGVWIGGTSYFSEIIGNLYDVQAFDDYRLYAVGEDGVVISSSDGGNTCQENVISTVTLNVVDGLNDVYAFGDNGEGYKLSFVCVTSSVFSATVNYLEAQFSDESLNANTWLWDFGDGQTSTMQSPLHTYSTGGSYSVCLTVSSDSCGSDSYCDEVTICEPNISLMPEGSLDSTFDDDGMLLTSVGAPGLPYDIAIQDDGKIITAFGFYLARFNSDGSTDYSFDGDGQIRLEYDISDEFKPQKIDLTLSQQIIVAGIYNQSDLTVARLNADAGFDLSFNGSGWMVNNVSQGIKQNTVFDVIALPDGKTLASASYFTGELGIEKINADGSMDITFADNGEAHINPPGDATYTGTLAIQSDGKIVIGATKDYDDKKFEVIRLNADGSLDSTFGDDGIVVTNLSTGNDNKDYVEDILLQPDGKIIAFGTANANDDDDLNAGFALVRYSADGTIDTSFNGSGIVKLQVNGLASIGVAAALQPDGKIVLTGYVFDENSSDRTALVRLNTSGTIDSSFGNNGWIITSTNCEKTVPESVAIDNDKIYIEGSHTLYNYQCVLRYVNSECQPALADFTVSPDQLTVQFTDQSLNATSWLWNFGDGSTETSQNPSHTYALPGVYEVCLVTSNDCSADSICSTVTIIATGVQFQNDDFLFTASPNPFSDQTTIQFSLEKNLYVKLDLCDLQGRKIKTIAEGNFNAGKHQLLIEKGNLSAGMYMLRLKINSVLVDRKLIIQ